MTQELSLKFIYERGGHKLNILGQQGASPQFVGHILGIS